MRYFQTTSAAATAAAEALNTLRTNQGRTLPEIRVVTKRDISWIAVNDVTRVQDPETETYKEYPNPDAEELYQIIRGLPAPYVDEGTATEMKAFNSANPFRSRQSIRP